MRSVRPENGPPAASNVLEYPVDTRIATLQPVLRWRANADTRDANVTLVDEHGKPVWSGKAGDGSVRPAAKLSAATRYTWTVMTPDGIVGEARFETLAAEPLARAEKSAGAARSFSERVAYGILLQDLGADQDARTLWAQLARERPDLPELASLAR
jgi:hypothetical protein